MSRLSLAVVMATLITGCAQRGPGPLYMWDSFAAQQYQALLRDGTTEEQIRTLQAQAERSRGANAKLPPGFRAHLGLLQLNAGNLDEARQMWLAEKAAFPESAPYMDQLLKKLPAPAKASTSENPA